LPVIGLVRSEGEDEPGESVDLVALMKGER
jgi:hypothetical protein